MVSCQKLGSFLQKRTVKYWLKLKMLLLTVFLLILYMNMKMIFKNNKSTFGLQKWFWTLKMFNFCQTATLSVYKNIKISFGYVNSYAKCYWFLNSLFENSQKKLPLHKQLICILGHFTTLKITAAWSLKTSNICRP